MPEVVCNTTPLQYLHQAGMLNAVMPVVEPDGVVRLPDFGSGAQGVQGFGRRALKSRSPACSSGSDRLNTELSSSPQSVSR